MDEDAVAVLKAVCQFGSWRPVSRVVGVIYINGSVRMSLHEEGMLKVCQCALNSMTESFYSIRRSDQRSRLVANAKIVFFDEIGNKVGHCKVRLNYD